MQKRLIMIVIKLAIAAAAILFILKRVHYHEINQAFKNPHHTIYLYGAGLLLIPNLILHWYRWHFLLKLIQPKIKSMDSAASYFGGLVAGFVTPGRIGEFGRSLFLKEINRLEALGMVFIDKLYAFIAIIVGGLWGFVILIVFKIGFDAFLLWPLIISALFLTLLCFWLVLHPVWMRTTLYNLSLFLPRKDKIKQIIACMDQFGKKEGQQYTWLSFLVYCIYITQYIFLALAFESIEFLRIYAAATSTMLTKTLLPISLADIGIREGAAIYFFTQLQAKQVTAFVSSILLFLINIVVPTCFGLLFLNRLSILKKPKPFKAAKREEHAKENP